MSTNDTATAHFDQGEPIYYVHDEAGRPLSHHRTTQGAETALKFTAGAVGISETSLHR